MAASRYKSISRHDLSRVPGFQQVSPALGQLDRDAFEERFDDDRDEALALLAQLAQATDRELAHLARRLAGRLSLRLARSGRATERGVKRPMSVMATPTSADLDIDGSLEAIVDAAARQRRPNIEELRAVTWRTPTTAICLVVDRSGSMEGRRLAGAALAAATISLRAPGAFAVLAFSDTVIRVKSLVGRKPPERVVGDVLRLRGHGTTDVALALRAAKRELDASTATRKVTVLLSDAEVTTGSDPAPIARELDELVVIAPSEEMTHARALAQWAGASVVGVDSPTSVLDALRSVLT